MTRWNRRLLLTALMVLAAWAAGARGDAPSGPATQPDAAIPPGESRLVDRPDEIITVLDSGLTVIVKRYPAAPVVSARMHVRAGSIWEQQYAGAGISHLFEHLLHGGATERRTEAQSRELLDRIGASSNAYTSYDQTVYFINVPSEHAATAIDLLADWVTRPLFPDDEVERELGVVQRELERGEQEPDRQLHYKANEIRYRIHPARFPIIGHKAALARLTRADMLEYYRRMYVPSRVVFAVVGDIEPGPTLELVKGHFADFTARPDQPIVLPAEPPVTAPRQVVYPMDVAQVRFSIGFPTVELLHEDLYPLDVMMYVLAAGEGSRLNVELRDRRKLALSIDAWSWTPTWAGGTFAVSGLCLPEHWAELRQAVLEEFDRLTREPVDAAALERAKRQAAVAHVRRGQTAAAIASNMAASQLAIGDAHFDDRYVRGLQQVAAEQVLSAARKYFDPDKLLTALVVPRDFRVPPAPVAAAAASGPEATTRPDESIVVAPIRKVVLDNGLTVLLRRNTAVPLAAIQMHFGGGLLAEPPDRGGVCQLMVRAALRGTATRSAEQVFAAFEQAGGTLASESGRNSFSFSASVLSDQLERALPVFAEVTLRPSFPDAEVAQTRGLMLAAIARIDDQLYPSASRHFFQRFFGEHPYGRPVAGSADAVDKLTRAELVEFHRRWAVADNAVLAIFGDIDPERTEAQVRELFGAEAMARSPEPLPWPEPPAGPPEEGYFVQPSKLAEAAQVDMGFAAASFTDDDYYALTLLDTMISGYGLPGGWLHETLRGRQLVYVVHAVNIAWRQAGVFYIYAQCQPQKVRQTVAAIGEQLARARGGELTEQQLANAKGQVLAGELMQLQTNDRLAQQCALDELLGRGYDHYLKLSERINAVTLGEVNRVARTYLVAPVTTATTSDPEAAKPE